VPEALEGMKIIGGATEGPTLKGLKSRPNARVFLYKWREKKKCIASSRPKL